MSVIVLVLALGGCGGAAAEGEGPEPVALPREEPAQPSSGSLRALLSPIGAHLPPAQLAAIARFIRALERDPHSEVPGNDTGVSPPAALLLWLTESPDVTVSICPFLVGVAGEGGEDVGGRTTLASTFGMAAYLIEHPGADPTSAEVQVAGAESALRWYEASLRTGEAPNAFLDELRARRDRDGGLRAWYDEHQIRCGEQQAPPPAQGPI